MVKLISWNIARREEAWRCLLDTDADIALLQEASEPPADVARRLEVDPAPWRTAGAGLKRSWRAAVVKLSDRVGVQWLEPKSVEESQPGELAVSRLGTLAAAIVTPSTGNPFTAVSLYAPWEKPHSRTGSDWIYADGSVHRLISDLSGLIGQQGGMPSSRRAISTSCTDMGKTGVPTGHPDTSPYSAGCRLWDSLLWAHRRQPDGKRTRGPMNFREQATTFRPITRATRSQLPPLDN